MSESKLKRRYNIKRSDTARTARMKAQLKQGPYMPILDGIPSFLRYGKWSPLSYLFIIVISMFLVYYYYNTIQYFNMAESKNSGEYIEVVSAVFR